MNQNALHIALITEVYLGSQAGDRLLERLREAAGKGAELAILPELPLNEWRPASPNPLDEDAEPPDGPRQQTLSKAAETAGIALLGGAIVRDPDSGQRYNTACLYDRKGKLIHQHRKQHLPEEEGFWETSHYLPGDEPLRVAEGLGFPFGVQICSDINRPQGCQILAARGAQAILAPRATEAATWSRWEVVMRASAITCSVYIASVNRPGPEMGVPIGGPTALISPRGAVLIETTEPLATAVLERDEVERSRRRYPGYMPVRADLYSREWAAAAQG